MFARFSEVLRCVCYILAVKCKGGAAAACSFFLPPLPQGSRKTRGQEWGGRWLPEPLTHPRP